MELNKIHCIDCIEGMRLLSDNYIDLTVTSPPYDDLRTYGNTLKWNFDIFKRIAQELYRVTKEGGVVVWIVNDKTKNGSETGSSFRQALYFKEVGFNLHDTMIYAKNNPTPSKTNRYQPAFEYMFVLSKGKPKTFNPIMEDKIYKESRKEKWYNKGADGEQIKAKVSQTDKKLKLNIWHYSVGKHHTTKDSIAFKHPAIFPERLAEDHILSWSNEGDIVMDIFMGSGTSAKMALRNNRNFIGFEISEEYCNIANSRINTYINNSL